MDGFDEVVKEFLVESYDSLDQLDRDFVALEDSPTDRDRLASIFRTVHTIKGTSGFLGLAKLERITHVGENLLVPLRDGEYELTREMADGLLGMVDAIRDILGCIESDGSEGATEYEELAERLESLRNSGPGGEPPVSSKPEKDTTEPVASEPAQEPANDESDSSGKAADEQPASPPPTKSEPSPGSPAKKPESTGEVTERSNSLADSTVRIDVQLLDKLMNLVGELVLARNQILQFSSSTEDAAMVAASQRLNLITTELQEGVMKTRMQPIRNAWSKLPRVVRDLSAACAKQVTVKMEGADTELDKTILEAIKDPLTHIVRNSVDHGIESPDDRVANGKPASGTLCLRAFHEGGQVNIEIVDDGAGINVDRVRDKAIEKGLLTAAQAEKLSDRDATNLILLPGFSTASQVTNVSGRGVGMDVVKTNIEQIGGTLEIHSTPGEGTTLRIKIPLTLAIVPALIVRGGGDQYAIPQVSLLELVRLESNRAKTEIEYIHDAPVYRLRGNLLPLVYLDEQLELRERSRRKQDETVNIVVLQAEDRQFGLVVDSITDTQEIVVKPLGQHLKGISTFAGSTIMGDGSVALILDVIGLAQKGNVLAERHDQGLRGNSNSANGDGTSNVKSLLVVDPGDGSHIAVRLSTVARLEEFHPEDIERTGHVEVVQYRNQIMPLMQLNGGCASPSMDQENGRIPVVVYSSGSRSVGIIVGRIVDIVQQTLDDSGDDTMSGRHVVQGRVTELVNLEDVIRSTFPEIFDHTAA